MEQQQLGKYVLDELIAVGGMAEIYRAHTVGLGGVEKILAIKRLHEQYCSDRDFVEMLVDEARIAVQLNHKNIGQVFDLEHEGNAYFIAMEFINGRDLSHVIRRYQDRQQVMPLHAAVYIAEEICSGLSYAHRRTDATGDPLYIIHRDISPQNVLCSFEGEVKIVDFGIAKAAKRASFTQSGVIKGKFHYMAPEQARGDRVDQRADIFAVGAILYEMITGQMLYQGAEDAALMQRVRRAEFSPPSAVSQDIPPKLEQIILKALQRDLRQRFQTAREMQLALSSFARDIRSHFDSVMLSETMFDLFTETRKSGVMRVPKQLMRDGDFERADNSLVEDAPFVTGPGDDEEAPTNMYQFGEIIDAIDNNRPSSGGFSRASLPSAPKSVDLAIDDRSKRVDTVVTGKVPERPRGYAREGSPPTLLFMAAIFGVLLLCWAFIFATSQIVETEAAPAETGPRLQKTGGVGVVGELSISSDPQGAAIWVDGEDTGLTTPASVGQLPEGAHTFALKLRFHHDAVRETLVEEGTALDVQLVPMDGILKIETSPPGATIHVNGEDVGTSPVNLDGRKMRDVHQVAASLDGYKDAVRTVRWESEEVLNMVQIPLLPLELRFGEALDALLQGARNHVIGAVVQGRRPLPPEPAVDAAGDAAPTERTKTTRKSNGRKSQKRKESGSKGLISVNAKPPGELYIDGKSTGKMTPVRGLTVSAGYHRVKVYYKASKAYSGEKRTLIKPGAEVKLMFKQ